MTPCSTMNSIVLGPLFACLDQFHHRWVNLGISPEQLGVENRQQIIHRQVTLNFLTIEGDVHFQNWNSCSQNPFCDSEALLFQLIFQLSQHTRCQIFFGYTTIETESFQQICLCGHQNHINIWGIISKAIGRWTKRSDFNASHSSWSTKDALDDSIDFLGICQCRKLWEAIRFSNWWIDPLQRLKKELVTQEVLQVDFSSRT